MSYVGTSYVGTGAFARPAKRSEAVSLGVEPPRPDPLAILAVQQIPHRPSASLVRLGHRLTLIGIHASLRRGGIALRLAARRTSVGKTRLPGLEFELL